MNMILIDKNDYTEDPNVVHIEGRRFIHIKEVLSPEPGSLLKCGELNGLVGTAQVISMQKKHVELKVSLVDKPPKEIPVKAIIALPRPLAFKRILQNITTMGVKHIFFINAARVEKSYWQSPVLKESCINNQIRLGLEQARDTILPEVRLCRSFKQFVEKELPDIAKGSKAVVAHPGSDKVLPELTGKPVILAVGPEGGFSQYETDKLSDCGFDRISMGERIFKTETALTALIAKVSI